MRKLFTNLVKRAPSVKEITSKFPTGIPDVEFEKTREFRNLVKRSKINTIKGKPQILSHQERKI